MLNIGVAPPGERNRVRTQPSPWLLSPRLDPRAALRLVCLPHAGGAAAMYAPWARTLPPAIDVLPIQLPGRANRMAEPPYTSMPQLVQDLASALEPYLDRPFAFFGHSMGALVSFELARTLRHTRGLEPVCLFVSGHRAPQLPTGHPPIHNRPEPEFLAELRRLNGTPREVLEHEELLELLLPLLRADFALCETYAFAEEPPLTCPILALGGLQDTDVQRDDLEAWRLHTHAACSVRMFPGDHFYLTTAGHLVLNVLARELVQLVRPG